MIKTNQGADTLDELTSKRSSFFVEEKKKQTTGLKCSGISLRVFLVAVSAAVYLVGFVGEIENLGQLLLDGGDAAWVVAFDDSCDLLGQFQGSLFNDLAILDYVDGDVVINVSQHIKVQGIDVALDLEDIFFAHGLTLGVLDDGNCGIQFIKSQVSVYLHALAGLYVVKNETFFDFSYIKHLIKPHFFQN